MEELQSTEILDREILEDARKKALRVLKAADDTVRAQTAEWETKTAQSIEELEKKYNEDREAAADKIMARLPIDKRRAKVEKIESFLQSAVEAWYQSLSRAKVLELLSEELKKRILACGVLPGEKRAFFYGINGKEAQETLKTAGITCAAEENANLRGYPSIILETGNTRIIASIQNIVDFLLQEKRSELVEALIGRGLMGEE